MQEGSLMRRAAITGWGHYTPPAVLSNADLASVIETSDEWITTRTGIRERHLVGDPAGAHVEHPRPAWGAHFEPVT